MENPPQRASVDSQRLVQRVVDRGAVVSKFLPRHLFSLGFVKMGWQRAGVTLLLLWARGDDVRRGQDST
jgi:hypothetical protein